MTANITLAMWGTPGIASWVEWFRFMEGAAQLLSSPLTHFGISGEGFGRKSIRPLDAFRLIESRVEESAVEWLSGYSLPNNFETAAFGYNIHMTRCSSYVAISAKEAFAPALVRDPESWKKKLMPFCGLKRGALFRMDECESPLLFVSGASSQESVDSFLMMQEFR